MPTYEIMVIVLCLLGLALLILQKQLDRFLSRDLSGYTWLAKVPWIGQFVIQDQIIATLRRMNDSLERVQGSLGRTQGHLAAINQVLRKRNEH